jgi:tRNA(Ile)-lysidine synthase TilS/MesJ
VNRFETAAYAETYKMGIQQAAREIRYAWFDQLMKEIKTSIGDSNDKVVLLTAHHADDQVETVLMQLFRGTGLHDSPVFLIFAMIAFLFADHYWAIPKTKYGNLPRNIP